MMDAKEYLGRVRLLEARVNQKQRQREEVLTMIEGVRSMSFGGRVDGSKNHDRITDAVIRLEKVEEECADAIAEFCEEKEKIINQIHKINDQRYEEILVKHYIEQKNLLKISHEMIYSYDYIREIHPKALSAFERVLMAS